MLFAIFMFPAMAFCKDFPDLKLKPAGIFSGNEKFYYSIVGKKSNKESARTFVSCFIENGILTISDSLNNSSVDVDAVTLKPIEGSWTIEYEGRYDVHSRFDADSIFVEASTPQGPQKVALPMPAGLVLHNDELLMALRAMDFSIEKQKTKLFIPASASIIDMVVIVKGKEKIEVPAGKFNTYKVVLDFGVAVQTAWYEVEKPHRMVSYDNDVIRYQLE